MIETRPWSHDAAGKVTKWWHYDRETDEVWIETVMDLDSYGETSKDLRDATSGQRYGDGLQLIGQLPPVLYWRLKAQGVFDPDDNYRAFRRWWNSDEALPFKCRDIGFGRRT